MLHLSRLLPARMAKRPLASVLALTAALSASLLLLASPAGAFVAEVAGTTVGLQKHSVVLGTAGSEPHNFNNSNGNPVVHGSNTYAVYWDPTDRYHADWQNVVDTFMQNMGAASGSLASVFAVDTQYTDRTNAPASYKSRFLGAYTDTAAFPSAGCTDPQPLEPGDAITCLTDKQIREQLESFIPTHGLQKGMGTIFYLLTPPGVTVCVDEAASHCSSNAASANSFCSYHSAISPTAPTTGDGNTILYGVIPWSAGGLGDPLLLENDRTSAFDCQDGGFDPSSKPVVEKKEKAKEKTTAETEAYEKATKEEKEQLKRAEEREGPHQQEPNQEPCPTVGDGGCDTGLADVIISQIGAEQQNIVTNPLLNAWKDPKQNEATDECRNYFAQVLGGSASPDEFSGAGTLFNQRLANGNYYLQDAFNLAAYKLPYPGAACLTHVNLVPTFTAPDPVNAGEVVGFDGMESNISLNAAFNFPGGGSAALTYATYTWNFGDGSPLLSGYAPGAPVCTTPWLSPCAASEFHSYQYGGTYQVTLTVTDVGGNSASTTNPVTVVGPAPPSPEGASGGPGGNPGSPGVTPAAQAGSQASPGAGSPAGGGNAVKRPVATAAASSQSLRSVMRSGVLVRYSVNEQVAGRLELLLPRSIARRVGIGGPPAFGLPAGSAPAVVVGKASVVTTKAGRSALRIQLSKRTASRLGKLHRVTLMLRLVVHGAQTPAPTTVLSTVTLGH